MTDFPDLGTLEKCHLNDSRGVVCVFILEGQLSFDPLNCNLWFRCLFETRCPHSLFRQMGLALSWHSPLPHLMVWAATRMRALTASELSTQIDPSFKCYPWSSQFWCTSTRRTSILLQLHVWSLFPIVSFNPVRWTQVQIIVILKRHRKTSRKMGFQVGDSCKILLTTALSFFPWVIVSPSVKWICSNATGEALRCGVSGHQSKLKSSTHWSATQP